MPDNFKYRDALGRLVTVRAKDAGSDLLTEQVGNEAGSQVDGHSVTTGTTTDARWTGSGAGTLVALLKDIALKLAGSITATITGNVAGTNAAGSQADGHSATFGLTTDVAVTGDTAGTLSAKQRGLNKMLTDVWDSVNHRLNTSGGGTQYTDGGTGVDSPIGTAMLYFDSTSSPAAPRAVKDSQPFPIQIRDNTGSLVGSDSSHLFWIQRPANAIGTDQHAITPTTGIPITINGNGSPQQIVAAPGAGHHLRFWWIAAYTASTSTVQGLAEFRPNGGTNQYSFPLSTTFGDMKGHNLKPNYWKLPSNTALYSGAGQPTNCNLTYVVEYDDVLDTAGD